MVSFQGFPSKTTYAALPNLFFSAVLPEIEDLAELKVTLHLLWLLLRKRGYPRYVAEADLEGDATLLRSLQKCAETPLQALRGGLNSATKRGTFLRVPIGGGDKSGAVYLLNTEVDRKAAKRIAAGEIELPGSRGTMADSTPGVRRPNIFALYEQNIGLLTPLIAEELREAEELYPATWIEDAFREAVALNKRNWRYIARILERWATEGRDDGKSPRDSQARDAQKYLSGRYGHLIQH